MRAPMAADGISWRAAGSGDFVSQEPSSRPNPFTTVPPQPVIRSAAPDVVRMIERLTLTRCATGSCRGTSRGALLHVALEELERLAPGSLLSEGVSQRRPTKARCHFRRRVVGWRDGVARVLVAE